jgi:UDPglucose 6-dehydrogenase
MQDRYKLQPEPAFKSYQLSQPYKVGIIGYGYVGKAFHKIFAGAKIYNRYSKDLDKEKQEINSCDLVILSVPTPTGKDGWSCDYSLVEEYVKWITVPICIKSTIAIGTTDYLKKKYGKRICFSPEYVGEGHYFTPPWKYPDPQDPISHPFMIIGGDKKDTSFVVDVFIRKLGPHTFFYQTNAKTAEFIKYMENVWGATKVTWSQVMYQCAQALGVDFNEAREGWALDPRVEKMHTAVFVKSRGYSGKCFPKDVRAFIKTVKDHGYNPTLLEEVVKVNNEIRKANGQEEV